ncbi:dTDP-4-dehydrorhamnose 3,5-epimerase [Candidatus Methylopumilus universalis]|uniref:dTDP-4-dehydrorhamnose 3,5-epimerase n=1 Tax=Candidatus Methylopumilus universalis TaxID=2588536 RepID=UPI003BEF0174
MKVTPLSIPDVLLIEPSVFDDSRGFFFESFREDIFRKETSLNVSFVQDNQVSSRRGVLRGLHYQVPPYAQGKLVRVIHGEVLDVALDIRKSSPAFGKHVTNILSAKNKKQIWIPEGFAHGFLTLSKNSEFLYKVTSFYKADFEKSILWSDPILNISWPTNIDIITSPRDSKSEAFSKAYIFEEL